MIPAPSKESNQPISSTPISSELPPEPSKIIKPEKNPPVHKTRNVNIAELNQFLSKYNAIENTPIKLQFTKDFIEIRVQTSDFFISEKFPLEEGQSEINGLVEVNAVHFIEIVSALSQKGLEITFELKDNSLNLTPDTSITVERVVEAKPPKIKNILVIPDQSLLRWFASLSLAAQKGESPANPYIDGTLTRFGLRLMVANPLMSASYLYPINKLKDWESVISITETTHARVFLPTKAILELPSNEKLEIHVGGRHLLLKAGSITVRIERFKDPLFTYIHQIFNEKRGTLSFTLMEPESPTEPSRMEKLINWQNQTKAKACDLIAGPNGLWAKPTTKVKNLDFLKSKEIPNNALQLFDMPCGNINRIASIPRVVIEAIEKLEIKKDVTIFFPEKEGDTLCIKSMNESEYSEIWVKSQFVEFPIAEVVAMPVAELADSKPLVIEKGGETLMEVVPTVAEAINTAIADAQKAIAETAIVEAIDPNNVVTLDSKTKKKAKLLQEAVQATKMELETELKSESIDLNRIIELTLRLDTVGGRFIEIVFSLKKNFISVLNIDEKFKEDAAKAYPHLAQ